MICSDLSLGSSTDSPRVAETGPVLRELFEHAAAGVLVCRIGSTGAKVVGANPAAGALLGCDAAELLGHAWRLRVAPRDLARLDRGLRGTLDGDTSPTTMDLALPDGRTARATLTAVPSADVVVAHLTAWPPPA